MGAFQQQHDDVRILAIMNLIDKTMAKSLSERPRRQIIVRVSFGYGLARTIPWNIIFSPNHNKLTSRPFSSFLRIHAHSS